jgi:subtilisin family serine protease
VILIAAAGNAGPKSPPLYPGADSNVIAVTATDERDAVFPDANRGSYVALAAPGVNILEPAPSGGYQITTGTSVAAAHVSGVAALLLERSPKLDAARLRDILQSTARDLGPKGRDDDFGWGLVDPYRALQALNGASAPTASAHPDTQRASTTPMPASRSPASSP